MKQQLLRAAREGFMDSFRVAWTIISALFGALSKSAHAGSQRARRSHGADSRLSHP